MSPSQPNQPTPPIPPPLKGSEPGTWAESTLKARIPEIARRTLEENDFPPAVVARIEALISEVPGGTIRHLAGGGPEASDWRGYIAPYLGGGWLDVPWFFGETYFYRRLLEATGYFEPGETQGLDPFRYQKELGLSTTMDRTRALSERVLGWIDGGVDPRGTLVRLLYINLWGNQADLSLWPAGQEGETPEAEGEIASDEPFERDRILVDRTRDVSAYLCRPSSSPKRVDLILDNAGFELVGDLHLAYALLRMGIAARVHLHAKFHPTFVSDAMVKDVRHTIGALAKDSHPAVRTLGAGLDGFLEEGKLVLRDDYFWTSPLAFWEMPHSLGADLARSALLVSKGDANYRRLLGDRHWDYMTPFEEIMAYTPAPLVAVRALKAEVAAGLREEQLAWLPSRDPDWMVDGKWGMIQFVE